MTNKLAAIISPKVAERTEAKNATLSLIKAVFWKSPKLREGERGREGPLKILNYASERRAAIQNFEASERATRVLAARSLAAHEPFYYVTKKYLNSDNRESPRGFLG